MNDEENELDIATEKLRVFLFEVEVLKKKYNISISKLDNYIGDDYQGEELYFKVEDFPMYHLSNINDTIHEILTKP